MGQDTDEITGGACCHAHMTLRGNGVDCTALHVRIRAITYVPSRSDNQHDGCYIAAFRVPILIDTLPLLWYGVVCDVCYVMCDLVLTGLYVCCLLPWAVSPQYVVYTGYVVTCTMACSAPSSAKLVVHAPHLTRSPTTPTQPPAVSLSYTTSTWNR